MPNTVFFIEIVGFFSRTIGFADLLYAAVGMFHGKHMFRREHFRFVQRHCSTAKKRRIKRRLRRVKLKQKLFSYYSVCIDGDTVR